MGEKGKEKGKRRGREVVKGRGQPPGILA